MKKISIYSTISLLITSISLPVYAQNESIERKHFPFCYSVYIGAAKFMEQKIDIKNDETLNIYKRATYISYERDGLSRKAADKDIVDAQKALQKRNGSELMPMLMNCTSRVLPIASSL